MKTRLALIAALAVSMGFASTLSAQDPVETVKKGCASEIESFCSQVTPGEGRLLACFYAFEDKLSGQCQYALYDAAAELDRAVSALNYLANECHDDILNYCGSVQVGEGRIVECLQAKGEDVSAGCRQAMADVLE
ncbi:MAG: cysteine rich repeat-containing protein [Lysobacterales bacterium]|jgi:hypothetical protein